MYRRRFRGSQKFNERMARLLDRKEQIRLEGPAPGFGPNLPEIRRRVIVEDYDFGETVRHEFVLYRSNHVDCYHVEVDGKRLALRLGWSSVLELVRKAFIRVWGSQIS